jgi:hypothetical protein
MKFNVTINLGCHMHSILKAYDRYTRNFEWLFNEIVQYTLIVWNWNRSIVRNCAKVP